MFNPDNAYTKIKKLTTKIENAITIARNGMVRIVDASLSSYQANNTSLRHSDADGVNTHLRMAGIHELCANEWKNAMNGYEGACIDLYIANCNRVSVAHEKMVKYHNEAAKFYGSK